MPIKTVLKKQSGLLFAVFAAATVCSLYVMEYYVNHIADPQSRVSIYMLWLAIVLLLGKLSGAVERFGQAAVLGELIVGLLLGNATLVGITFLEPMKTDAIIGALSRLGTVILFFQAGLVSDFRVLLKLWKKSLTLAILGIIFSIIMMYIALPFLIPGQPLFVYIFLSVALSPTGTGVTARVLQDLGKLNIKEAQLILSSGAIDNIICFILLAILTAFQTGGISHTAIGMLLAKVIILLIAIVLFCVYLLPVITKKLAEIYPSRSLKFALAFGITLLFSYLAHSVGISPIIGAFMAGIAMSPIYFTSFKPAPYILSLQELILQNGHGVSPLLNEKYKKHINEAKERDLEDMLSAPAFLLVAVFFVVTGMGVPLSLFTNIQIVQSAVVILLLAFASKFLASRMIGQKIISVVGAGMAPRGVTTLVFATAGKNFKILSPDLYALIVLTVMLTTFVTPIMLSWIVKRNEET